MREASEEWQESRGKEKRDTTEKRWGGGASGVGRGGRGQIGGDPGRDVQHQLVLA